MAVTGSPSAVDAALHAATPNDTAIAEIVSRFEEAVESVVRDATVQLSRLGLDEALIVALLGLPLQTLSLVGTQVSTAA